MQGEDLKFVFAFACMQGELDPAFAFACMQCDFQYARPWRDNNVPMIDKAGPPALPL